MNTSGTLIITQGDTESLTIETGSNIMPHIEAEVKGKSLSLSFKGDTWRKRIRPTIPITYKLNIINLAEAKLSGSGTIKASSINAKDLELGISGSGNIILEQLRAKELAVDLSGSGNIILSGNVDKQKITLSGSDDYQAPKLVSQTVKIKIRGSGNVTVYANQMLDVRISGSGDVNYHGKPRLTTKISGSGNVNNLSNP